MSVNREYIDTQLGPIDSQSMYYSTVILIALFIATTSQSVLAQDTTRYNLGCGSDACIIAPYEVEGPAPTFLIRARSIQNRNLPVVVRLTYRRAMRQFPDTQACLTGNETAQGYDLMLVNWSEITTLEHLEICLSHIHNALQTAENSVLWFKAAGFQARQGTVRVFAEWVSEEPFPIRFATRENRKRLSEWDFKINVEREPAGRVIDVGAEWVRK